jgi:hypothetical protein
MTRLHLLIAAVCVTSAAASLAPTAPKSVSSKLATAAVAPATRKADAEPNISWLARYGSYDVRKGTLNLNLSSPDGC